MPVKKYLLRAAGLLALAALAFFLLRPPAKVQNRIVLDERRPASAVTPEATVRNVTKKDLAYTIEPNPYAAQARTRTLAVGAVDRIATDIPVKITYDNGARRESYTIFPGKPYSFRYDENGLVRVYPGSHGREDAADLAPFVPSPPHVVDRMLILAGVGPDDVVYDIGCGDGRIVIAAAKTYGARGVGIDIDPQLIEECRANAKREGVEPLTRFICADATKAHVAPATVLVLYLLPESLETLKPLFEKELRPGVRIVSHNYRVPGWDDRIVASEAVPVDAGRPHKIYLYRKPAVRS
jgi:SAM-dependent methyltransferase